MDEEFAEQDNEKLITKELKLGEKKRQENLVRARLVENNGPNSKEVLAILTQGFLSHEYEMKRYE